MVCINDFTQGSVLLKSNILIILFYKNRTIDIDLILLYYISNRVFRTHTNVRHKKGVAMSTPTYRDIQKITGVSLSTISRYFNGEALRDKSVELIEQAIVQLDYKPHQPAFTNKKHKSKLVGLLLPTLTHSPFYMQLCAELERAFGERGMGTLVCNFSGTTDYDEKAAIKLLLDNHVCAIIAIPNESKTLNLVNLQNRNIPIVLLDKLSSDIKTDAVIVDNKALSAMAVDEFCAHNHKKIAIITAGVGYTSQMRIEGYSEAMKKHNLPVLRQYILETSMNPNSMKLEIEQFLSTKNLPTAIFCANYKAMMLCLAIMNERKINIPNDISFIGVDDISISKVTTPNLTMILQSVEKIADCAADITINKLTGKQTTDSYYTLELPTVLVKGGSIKQL